MLIAEHWNHLRATHRPIAIPTLLAGQKPLTSASKQDQIKWSRVMDITGVDSVVFGVEDLAA
ncbi:MAG TPA: hypothetical protein VHX19_00050, partial [Stellaceae bacterium]|nr:hypothetical protein [Stellaceae bacterium]